MGQKHYIRLKIEVWSLLGLSMAHSNIYLIEQGPSQDFKSMVVDF